MGPGSLEYLLPGLYPKAKPYINCFPVVTENLEYFLAHTTVPNLHPAGHTPLLLFVCTALLHLQRLNTGAVPMTFSLTLSLSEPGHGTQLTGQEPASSNLEQGGPYIVTDVFSSPQI